MTQPIISWTNVDGDELFDNKLDFGIVDAGDASQDFTILVWNNKGGETLVSDITDCTITTRDSLGGIGTDDNLSAASSEIITNKWIEVRLAQSEEDYSPIGGLDVFNISADEEVYDLENQLLTNAIGGKINDGELLTSASNYATLIFRANIPADASSGNVDFLTRISYRYI